MAPDAERVRARTGLPVVVNTQPQHRRPADGRRPAGRAGVLRLGAGRPARARPVPRCAAAPRVRERTAVTAVRTPSSSRPSGGQSLPTLLASLAAAAGRLPDAGRRGRRPRRGRRRRSRRAARPLAGAAGARAAAARGPAAARNVGWRAAPATEWVAFLDDDVVPAPDWRGRAGRRPRRGRPATSAACRAGSRVPLPADRRPTDWERNTAGLGAAPLGHRRHGLPAGGAGRGRRLRRAVPARLPGGRRPRAAGARRRLAARARRRARSPTRCGPADRWVSVRAQRGNADDALMRRAARAAAGASGRARRAGGAARRARSAVTARRALAVVAARPAPAAPPRPPLALAGPAGTRRARLAPASRPGPRTAARGGHDGRDQRRSSRRAATLALAARLVRGAARGAGRVRRPAVRGRAVRPRRHAGARRALQRRPGPVRPMPGAREALDRLRAAGLRLGVVTNQSGVARGLLTRTRCAAVNARVEELLGPFDPGRSARTAPDDGCALPQAARPAWSCAPPRALGVDPGALRRRRRHRRRRATPPAPPGPAAVLVPTAGHPRRGGRAPRRRWPPTSRRPSTWSCGARWQPAARPARPHVLVARLDSDGDVLLAGPAIRAVAAGADRVALLCGPRGAAAAELLPGVDEVLELARAVDRPEPGAGRPRATLDAPGRPRWRARRVDEAVVLTSFHQSPLPLALLLRLAGVAPDQRDQRGLPGLAARRPAPRSPDDVHEVERALSLAAAAGYRPAARRRRPRCARRRPPPASPPTGRRPLRRRAPRRLGAGPGLGAERGRADSSPRWPRRATGSSSPAARASATLTARGRRRPRAAATSAGAPTWPSWPRCSPAPTCVVVGNTGPAHLAAAVGTPGGLAVRPDGAGRALGALRRAARAARRPAARLRGHPGARLPGARPPVPDRRRPPDDVRRRGRATRPRLAAVAA